MTILFFVRHFTNIRLSSDTEWKYSFYILAAPHYDGGGWGSSGSIEKSGDGLGGTKYETSRALTKILLIVGGCGGGAKHYYNFVIRQPQLLYNKKEKLSELGHQTTTVLIAYTNTLRDMNSKSSTVLRDQT